MIHKRTPTEHQMKHCQSDLHRRLDKQLKHNEASHSKKILRLTSLEIPLEQISRNFQN